MPIPEAVRARLAEIPDLCLFPGAPLSLYTRFALGGPADLFAETASAEAFARAIAAARASGLPLLVIGGGTNLVVSDAGFRGIVVRYRGESLTATPPAVTADSGATLQSLVDFANAHGLRGLETLAGIPGSVGAAVYGNAGAYGHSISERVSRVRFFDGESIRAFDRDRCQFLYRESVFKSHKEWIIFAVEFLLEAADPSELAQISADILKVRNQKFPATMKCAGSVFKNLIFKELPPEAAATVPAASVREGKVPAAWFLDQVGAKGMSRGDIHVATYHANLLYNGGQGTASGLRALIAELKARVRDRFGIVLEEEVQYVGD